MSYRIETGEATQHHYGWRPSLGDKNIRKFVPKQAVLDALPTHVDLFVPDLPPPFNPVFDQGALGSCGPNTAAEDIIFAALRQDKLATIKMPSRLFIYWTTRLLMGSVYEDSGVDNKMMIDALVRYGWCDEELFPYNPSQFKVKPSQAAFDQAAGRRIPAGAASKVEQDLRTMQACLAGGDTFWFGFSVYEDLESQEVARSGIMQMPRPGERVLGGHDVIIGGFSDPGDPAQGWPAMTFKARNSWGPWGWKGLGYFFIPYAFATDPDYASDFRTISRSGLPLPPPIPIPVPVPPTPVPPVPVPPNGGTMVLQPYPTSMPDGWMSHLLALAANPASIDIKKEAHFLYHVAGYAAGQLLPDKLAAVLASKPVLSEHLALVQAEPDLMRFGASSSPNKALPWANIISIILAILQGLKG